MNFVDCIYLAACARDARLTRICVASIRYFYPDVPIRLLAGDILQHGLAEELHHYWGVELVNLPEGDYGWGLVKLEPLFGQPGEKFLVMDVDTIFTGPVLDLRADNDAPFLVDNERLSDADFKRLYYDWDELREIDPEVPSARMAFNAGQWFGTAGLVTREEFEPWLEFAFPRRLKHPHLFMGGDQGVLNCVILKKEACAALRIERRQMMRWPGHSLNGLDLDAIVKRTAPACVIHWAGMKTILLRNTVGAELLIFFEKTYYQRLPMGWVRRVIANSYHVWIQWKHFVNVRAVLAYRKWVFSRTRASETRAA